MFRKVSRFSADASFLLQSFFRCSVLKFLEHKDYAREVSTSEQLLAMDPFFTEFLRV